MEEHLGGTTLKTRPDARQVMTFRGLAILHIYSCLGETVCRCPFRGNSIDQIKDNAATMVEKGWKKSQDVRLKYKVAGDILKKDIKIIHLSIMLFFSFVN